MTALLAPPRGDQCISCGLVWPLLVEGTQLCMDCESHIPHDHLHQSEVTPMTVTLPAAAKADICRRIAGAIISDGGEPGATTSLTSEELCDEYGLLKRELMDLITKHGFPRPESLKKASDLLATGRPALPAPLPSPATSGTRTDPAPVRPSTDRLVDGYAALLGKAAKSDKARIRNLGIKIAGMVSDLGTLIADEEAKAEATAAAEKEKAQARAEVERLEKELREAKAKLGIKTTTSSPSATDGPTPKRVREWATKNGVECPRTGRVPASVLAAYHAATENAA